LRPIPPELLSWVPGCGDGAAPLSVQALVGGREMNSVWHLQTRAGEFVLRVRHEPINRPGSFSGFELASHRLAAAAGLAPGVHAAAPDGRWLVMDFVVAPLWSPAQLLSDSGLAALGGALRRLHALDCQQLPRLDAVSVARGYQAQILAQQPARSADAAVELAAIEAISRELAGLSDRAVLNHGDLMATNLLGPVTGSQPLLVDWEYAQRTDPTWDVACLLTYYPSLESRLEPLLAALGLASAEDRQILSLQRRLFEALNRLWQHSQPGNWIS
jgi:aminoglycoside phosphotransferase (APT) family kinase protein